VKSINSALELLNPEILRRSGRVFYAGADAFAKPSRVYLLGLNPGGDPVAQSHETIASDLDAFRARSVPWSAYVDDSWNGAPAGTWGMQPGVRRLLVGLGIDPRQIPSSNVVFVRSRDEAALHREKGALLHACWPIHEAVINSLGVKTVVCFGKTAGRWVRERLDANDLVDSFRETNKRGWLNEAYRSAGGQTVVTLTHPSRADWRNPEADPTSFVARTLERGCP